MRVSIALVSKDETLVKFCQEILAELYGTDWALVSGIPGQLTSRDDLCIWEFTPGETAIPQDLEPASLRKHWFLLYRKDLSALQAAVGSTELNVLLKPVTRATMRAFLAGANWQRNELRHGDAGRAAELRVERDEMLQFLIQANLKLQEYDQERNNFLARSVHEFRAPLTAISGYCGLLLEEALGPLTAEQGEVLKRMQHSAARLSRISTAMFQLSLPHNVPQEPVLEKNDIRECLDQALHEVALAVDDKRISITAEIEPAPDGLYFEKSQLEQAFVNLLDNACKFTPRDGMIAITGYPFFWERRTGQAASLDRALERRSRQAKVFNSFRVDIQDSGPGIPAAHVARIFEEYTSYGGGQVRSGGGLGLAICRMILNRHRGRIWAESSPSGAVFSFVLPLRETDGHVSGVGDYSEAACTAGSGEVNGCR